MKVLFEHEKAILQLNEEVNSIELIWQKRHDPETYKMVFIKTLDFIKQYKLTGFLSDIRNEGIVSPETSNWVQTEIMPKAFEYGLKKIAIVLDADVFKEFYIKNIKKAAGSDQVNYFDSLEAANEWLVGV